MLRFLLFLTLSVTTFTLGLWAYKINYESRAANQRVKELEKLISAANSEAKLLNAEWAHLNHPDRLRKLVEYYFLELRLSPINPDDLISFSELYKFHSHENIPTASVGKRLMLIDHDE